MTARGNSRKWFGRFAWGVLAYNIPVILWGAYVRVSFSGDGCGAHWPFCNGVVVPQHMATPMAIEFAHRAMTSIDTMATIALCVWAFVAFPRKHPVRMSSVLSLVFLLIEALLGAGLVLLRYVARDQSAGRAWYLSAHLTNTMLLLAALTLTAWLVHKDPGELHLQNVAPRFWGALGVGVAVSVTGALAALGDTLFPATSLALGMQQDFSSASTGLLRLRSLHPAIAIAGAVYFVWVANGALKAGDRGLRLAAGRVVALTVVQIVAGAVNVSLLAPVWMQLTHLLLGDVLWIALVIFVLARMRVARSSSVRVGIEAHHFHAG